MTPDLARRILDLHSATKMTQQEIAFRVGVNQGRVNEVIKRGKWLDGSTTSPEAQSRDRALAKLQASPRQRLHPSRKPGETKSGTVATPSTSSPKRGQLTFGGI